MPCLPLSLLVLIACVITTPASAKELWKRTWIEVRSAHFVIVSAISAERTVNLARDLEGFRAAVQIITNIGRFEERIPTTVYVLPHRIDELGFKNNIVGYFIPRMRANYAAVFPVLGGHLDDTLKHEYVHFLVHNRDALSYPPWFDEGFAELLSTLTARGDMIEYGKPMSVRLNWLRYAPWISSAKLLATRNVFSLKGNSRAMFYAQSWLLMHYLTSGRPERKFDADNRVFLGLVEAGTKPTDAFERAFGIPVSALRRRLVKYAGGHMEYHRATLTRPLPDAPTQIRSMADDAIAAQMGLLLLILDEKDDAKRYWDAALALNPNNTMALVGLGDLHKFAGRFDAAQPYYDKAIALEPQNAYPELDYAEYFLDRAGAAKDSGEIANHLSEARRHFARSYKLDPDVPETLAMNGSTYLLAGESVDKALQSLTAAHEMLPSQPAIKLLLAKAYIQAGAQANATRLLRSLVAWSGDEIGEEANKLLQQLTGAALEADESASEAAPAGRTADE